MSNILPFLNRLTVYALTILRKVKQLLSVLDFLYSYCVLTFLDFFYIFIYFFLTCQLAIELSATDIYQEISEVQTFEYDMVQETVFFCPIGNIQALPLCQVLCLLQVCVG